MLLFILEFIGSFRHKYYLKLENVISIRSCNDKSLEPSFFEYKGDNEVSNKQQNHKEKHKSNDSL